MKICEMGLKERQALELPRILVTLKDYRMKLALGAGKVVQYVHDGDGRGVDGDDVGSHTQSHTHSNSCKMKVVVNQDSALVEYILHVA